MEKTRYVVKIDDIEYHVHKEVYDLVCEIAKSIPPPKVKNIGLAYWERRGARYKPQQSEEV